MSKGPRTTVQKYLASLRYSFPYFVREVWRVTGLEDKAPIGMIEDDIFDWIIKGPDRTGVLAWRFFGKTRIISVTYSLWQILRDPDHKVMIVSKSSDQAEKIVGLARDWIDTIPFLEHLKPKRTEKDRDARYQFDVAGCQPTTDPSFCSKGIESSIAGTRAHTLIADDIEDEENTITAESRERLFNRTAEFEAIAAYPTSRVIIIGTFHHDDSVYKRLAGLTDSHKVDDEEADEEPLYKFRTWPIVYPSPGETYIGLSPLIQERLDEGYNKPDDIVAPYRITKDFVKKKRRRGTRFFGMQYKLQVNLRETLTHPLKLADLIVFDSAPDRGPLTLAWGEISASKDNIIPQSELPMYGFPGDCLRRPIFLPPVEEWTKWHRTAMWVDPAGGGKDKFAFAIASSLNGYVHLQHVEGLDGGPSEENFNRIAKCAYDFRVRHAYCERNFGGNAYANLLQISLNRLIRQAGDKECPEGWGCSVETMHSSGQKELRIIDSLDSILKSHRLVVSRAVVAQHAFQYQLTHITSNRKALQHDDEIETVAMLVRELAATTVIDPLRADAEKRERKIDEFIRKHARNAPVTWLRQKV